MSNAGKAFIWILIAVVIVCLTLAVSPVRRYIFNKLNYVEQKIDDATNYDTLKKVEDTCRAMIASYNSDVLTYTQYKTNDDPDKQSWGEQAKMRANKTAATYNAYILENSFVWSGNVPADIRTELGYIN